MVIWFSLSYEKGSGLFISRCELNREILIRSSFTYRGWWHLPQWQSCRPQDRACKYFLLIGHFHSTINITFHSHWVVKNTSHLCTLNSYSIFRAFATSSLAKLSNVGCSSSLTRMQAPEKSDLFIHC